MKTATRRWLFGGPGDQEEITSSLRPEQRGQRERREQHRLCSRQRVAERHQPGQQQAQQEQGQEPELLFCHKQPEQRPTG